MGPLTGIKVVEFAGLGPAPFCGMLLADLGAEVVRIDRGGGGSAGLGLDPRRDVLNRGRRSLALNLKQPAAVEVALRLVERSDALIEGFRPGVMERLGLGPEPCLARNPRLVYGRMTGWGQTGPFSQRAGHDINYIALSGALDMIGRRGDEPPMFPLNLIGDMGGGGLLLAFGIACALLASRGSGRGQVVDAAMVEGAAVQLSGIMAMRGAGLWQDARGTNAIDGGSHFYEVYETADGRHMAVGAMEPAFYAALRAAAGLEDDQWSRQMDADAWPELKSRLAEVFRTRTRQEWAEVFADLDACVTPVLNLEEAAAHPHNAARQVFFEDDGVLQASPAPRFSDTPGTVSRRPPLPGEHSREVLERSGFDEAEITGLFSSGAVVQTPSADHDAA